MNRATSSHKEGPNVSIIPSSPSSSASHGTTRISTNNGSASNTSNILMNGNGELMFRRSPISHHHNHHHQASPQTTQTYYTLGSPSINTSYNSEEISDNINSSLEDEEQLGELSQRFEQLQRQVEILSESQATQDERYRRSKQENDVLLNRIHSLEDQLRELEINSETRAQEDEKRFKETMSKQIRLKSQECEQHLNVNCQLQQEIISLQKDLLKNETLIRTLRGDKERLESELAEKNNELVSLDEEIHKLRLLVKNLKDEESVKSNLISILNEELEDNHNNRSHQNYHHNEVSFADVSGLSANTTRPNGQPQTSSPKQQRTSPSSRSSITSGFGDALLAPNQINSKALKDIDLLEASLSNVRDENKRLKELNEELQAQLLQARLEEGRSLIQESNKSYSLADEMGDLDVEKIMEALREQQEVNARLRRYMDDILLRVVDVHPEILEKSTPSIMDKTNK